MSKQVLDISQMQHLKELGVDVSKASMKWVNKYQNAFGDDWEKVPVSVNLDTEYYQSFGYAFTLQDILDLLPLCIEHDAIKYELRIKRFVYPNGMYMYAVLYEKQDYVEWFVMNSHKNLIDAAYEILCWVIENGYLETK